MPRWRCGLVGLSAIVVLAALAALSHAQEGPRQRGASTEPRRRRRSAARRGGAGRSSRVSCSDQEPACHVFSNDFLGLDPARKTGSTSAPPAARNARRRSSPKKRRRGVLEKDKDPIRAWYGRCPGNVGCPQFSAITWNGNPRAAWWAACPRLCVLPRPACACALFWPLCGKNCFDKQTGFPGCW